jgi:hypothetical protein
MTDLPAPPVPADCDLRNFQDMPLEVDTLRDSDLRRRSTGDEFKAAVVLWAACWHQMPAGSLPDDDVELADLAGIGTGKPAVRAWMKVKPMALRGWYKASDGRLYHPVMSTKAIKSWGVKQASKRKRDQDAERLRRWRNGRGVTEAEWGEIRQAVFARDKNCCTRCGSREDLHCDHVISVADGGVTEDVNLITLCRSCHSRKTMSRSDEMHYVAERSELKGREGKRVDTTPAAAVVGGHPATPAVNSPRKVQSVQPEQVRTALATGDLPELIRAFGGNLADDRPGEWARDLDGLSLQQVAVLFAWRRAERQPIREPSGARKAREDWRALDASDQHVIAAEACAFLGIEPPRRAAGGESAP